MTTPIDYDALISDVRKYGRLNGAIAGCVNPVTAVENERKADETFAKIEATIRALRAAAVESERDAARYRWLRDGENGGDLSIGDMTESGDEGWERVTWLYEEELDTAIDAAMAAQEKAK